MELLNQLSNNQLPIVASHLLPTFFLSLKDRNKNITQLLLINLNTAITKHKLPLLVFFSCLMVSLAHSLHLKRVITSFELQPLSLLAVSLFTTYYVDYCQCVHYKLRPPQLFSFLLQKCIKKYCNPLSPTLVLWWIKKIVCATREEMPLRTFRTCTNYYCLP